MFPKNLMIATAITVCGLVAFPGYLAAQEKTLRIGQLGVMSGPAASWGLSSRYSAEALANMINAEGGWEIDGDVYRIEIVSVDDRNEPRTAIAGAERMIHQENIKYIIGTNVDDTTIAIQPVVNSSGAFNISYGYGKSLFQPPNTNTALGSMANYQSAPIVYKYLVDTHGIKNVVFVSPNDNTGESHRTAGIDAANDLGLEIISSDNLYEPGTADFYPILGPIVGMQPDLIVLSAVTPADAPLIVRTLRELGFQGIVSTETGQDAKVLSEIAGSLADGFVFVGGSSTEELSSPYMNEFMASYAEVAGEWNDEAGTKVYALYMILATLQAAGEEAIDDVEVFKNAMGAFEAPNPFVNDDDIKLRWVGQKWFGQPRQISVPVVINEYRDGEFKTLLVTTAE